MYQDCSGCDDLSKNIAAGVGVGVGDGAYFPYISIKKKIKIFLSETAGPISILHGKMFLWWPSNKRVQAIMISQKHGRQESFLYLSIQKSSFQKAVNRFQYIEAEMFFGNPVSSLKIGCDDLSKTHGRRGAGRRLFSLYIYIYIEDIQIFGVNMTFISSREVKKCIFHLCLRHEWNIHFFTSRDEFFSLHFTKKCIFHSCLRHEWNIRFFASRDEIKVIFTTNIWIIFLLYTSLSIEEMQILQILQNLRCFPLTINVNKKKR